MTVAKAQYLTAFQDVLTLDINTCTIEVCIASLPSYTSTPEFRRLELSEPLQDDFRALAATFLAENNKDWQVRKLQLLQFEADSKPNEDQVEHLDLSQAPYDNIIKQTQPLTLLSRLESFHQEPSFTKSMRFYVIILQPPHQGQPIYLYRRYGNSKILQQSSPLAIFSNNNAFSRVDTPIFLFDKHIDCISSGTNLFISAKSHFYYMFTILDDLIKSAQETLDRIEQLIPIVDFRSFRRVCIQDKVKMTKLTSIARRPYLDTLTISAMKPVIKKNHLHIPVEEVNGQEMLRFDSDYPNDILRLLNDDYLTSIMTGLDYEVDAKRDP